MSSSIAQRMSKDDHFRMGYFYQKSGDFQAAATCFKKSIEHQPSPEAHTCLAAVMEKLGDLDGAIEQCKLAVKLDPDFGTAWHDIGLYLLEKNKEDEAIEYFEKAIKAKDYEHPEEAHYNLAWIYFNKDMLLKSKAELEMALEIDQKFTEAQDMYLEIERMIQ